MALALRAVALVSLVSVWTACSLIGARLNEDGLARVMTSGPGTLYVKPDHPIGSYDSILLVPKVGIDYALGQEPFSPEVEWALADRMLQGLQRGARVQFPIVQAPEKCAVQLALWLFNVKLYESQGEGSKTSYVSDYGQATLVFEFRDSVTNEPLIQYGQTARLGGGIEGGASGPDIDRLNRAVDTMIRNVGNNFQDIVPVKGFDDAESGCNGTLGRTVLALREQDG